MELTLLGSVGLAAFLLCGAVAMLISSYRRTIELRGALIQALQRIERLERKLDLGGAALEPLAEAPAEGSSAEQSFTAAAEEALAEQRPTPPPPLLISITVVVAAIAAMTAAWFHYLSGQAGVFLVLVFGGVLLGIAEWRRRADAKPTPEGLRPDAPAMLALVAFALMAAAVIFGLAVSHALTPYYAILGIGVVALAAAALAARHGASLFVVAMACTAFAPALAPMDASAPIARYVLLAAIAAIVMALSPKGVQVWRWLATAIALAWGANGAAWGGEPETISAIGAYFATLIALGIAQAWDAPPSSTAWRLGLAIVSGGCAGMTLLVLAHATPLAFSAPPLAAMALLTAGASAARPTLWPAAFASAGASSVALAFWPGAADAQGFAELTAGLALIYALCGALMLNSAKRPAPGASVAAFAPLMLLAALHERLIDVAPAWIWTLAALAFAAVNALCFLQLRRTKPAAAAPFVSALATGLVLAFYVATPSLYAPLALAFALPALAAIDQRLNESGLRAAAIVLGAALIVRVVAPQLFIATATSAPLLVLLFGICAAATFAAATIFGRGVPPSAASQITFAVVFVLLASGVTLVVRHAFTADAIGARYASLGEMGANTLAWASLALVLAWRFGAKPRFYLYVLELAAFGAAAVHALLVGGVILNPWWGYAPAAVSGWPGANLIEFAYALPGLVFLAYAWLRHRQTMLARASLSAGVGVALLVLGLVLEIRRLRHGANMVHDPIDAGEAWAYGAVAFVLIAVLATLAFYQRRKTLRLSQPILLDAAAEPKTANSNSTT